MRLFVPLVVILFPLCTSDVLDAKKGYHRLKKLLKQRELTTISNGRLLESAKKHSTRQILKEKLNTADTSKGRYVFVKTRITSKNKLKRPIRKHRTSNSLMKKSPLQFFTKRPPAEEPNGLFQNTSVWIKQMPGGDFDEEVTDEGAATRNTIRDDALLERLRENENVLGSDKPITDDPDENEKEGNSTLARHDNEGRVVDDMDRHVEDEHETMPSRENGNGDDKEDEVKELEEVKIEDKEEQNLLNKVKQGENQIKPLKISDQTSQASMPNFDENQDEIDALVDREQRLQALREYSAQMKQQMLQRLRLGYEPDTMVQNSPQLPQYIRPRPWQYQEVRLNTPLFSVPSAPIYRPATFIGPPPRASPAAQTNNQGYTINVDGLKGVFSKEPGFVVRFHSPNSEVTVAKKDNVVMPMYTN